MAASWPGRAQCNDFSFGSAGGCSPRDRARRSPRITRTASEPKVSVFDQVFLPPLGVDEAEASLAGLLGDWPTRLKDMCEGLGQLEASVESRFASLQAELVQSRRDTVSEVWKELRGKLAEERRRHEEALNALRLELRAEFCEALRHGSREDRGSRFRDFSPLGAARMDLRRQVSALDTALHSMALGLKDSLAAALSEEAKERKALEERVLFACATAAAADRRHARASEQPRAVKDTSEVEGNLRSRKAASLGRHRSVSAERLRDRLAVIEDRMQHLGLTLGLTAADWSRQQTSSVRSAPAAPESMADTVRASSPSMHRQLSPTLLPDTYAASSPSGRSRARQASVDAFLSPRDILAGRAQSFSATPPISSVHFSIPRADAPQFAVLSGSEDSPGPAQAPNFGSAADSCTASVVPASVTGTCARTGAGCPLMNMRGRSLMEDGQGPQGAEESPRLAANVCAVLEGTWRSSTSCIWTVSKSGQATRDSDELSVDITRHESRNGGTEYTFASEWMTLLPTGAPSPDSVTWRRLASAAPAAQASIRWTKIRNFSPPRR